MLYTGNITITSLAWSESGGLVVRFASDHVRVHQLYIGRRLYGETQGSTAREIVAQYSTDGSRYPEHVAIVAVDPAEEAMDHGEKLPPRPYNRVRLNVPSRTLSGDPIADDVRIYQLFLGSGPEDEIDYETVRGVHLVEANKPFTLDTPPLGPSGTWHLGLRGRDHCESGGNPGAAAELSAVIRSYPPDFETDFVVAVHTGLATVTCTLPED